LPDVAVRADQHERVAVHIVGGMRMPIDIDESILQRSYGGQRVDLCRTLDMNF